MKQLIFKVSVVTLFTIVIGVSLTNSKELVLDKYSTAGLDLVYTVENEQNIGDFNQIAFEARQNIYSPLLDKSYVGFKEAIGFKESTSRYNCVNTHGYLGKYQFGASTLKMVGIYDTSNFLDNSKLQEKAFLANTSRNKWILRREIKSFVGKRIGGVLVTESGILAAAHLAGPGNVKHFLRSYGAIGFSDAYGTSITEYMKKFSGYDLSFVKANRKAKVI